MKWTTPESPLPPFSMFWTLSTPPSRLTVVVLFAPKQSSSLRALTSSPLPESVNVTSPPKLAHRTLALSCARWSSLPPLIVTVAFAPACSGQRHIPRTVSSPPDSSKRGAD